MSRIFFYSALTLLVFHAKWAVVIPGGWQVRFLRFAQEVLVVFRSMVNLLNVAVRTVNGSSQLQLNYS